MMEETGFLCPVLVSDLAKVGLALSLVSKLSLHNGYQTGARKNPRNKLKPRKVK